MSIILPVFRVLFRGALGACVKFILVVGAVFAGLTLFLGSLEAIWLAPWAYSFGGKPAMVGSWVGRFHSPSGASGAVYFDVHHWVADGLTGRSGKGSPRLHGEERWCFADGGRLVYPLHGISNPDASRVVIAFSPELIPPNGIYFTTLTGSWSGEQLRLTGTARTVHDGKWLFSPHTSDGKKPTEFELRRGDGAAFEFLCRQLR